MRVAVIVFGGLILAGPALPASASIVFRTQRPTEKQATEIFVQADDGLPAAHADVHVTYRPGSSVQRDEDIGTTDANGRVQWAPEVAGIATINAAWVDSSGAAHSMSTNISVKFASAPLAGIAIMLIAGLLLVGGSVVRIITLARSPD